MKREELVNNNLRLVHSLCKRFKGKNIEYDDLFGAGCLGLVKAANSFNEDLGYCFSTYAVPVILGEIKRLFRDGGAVKVSRSLKELSLRAVRESGRLSTKLGREPTVGELAEELQISAEEVAEALCAAVPPSSLSYVDESGGVCELDIGTELSVEDEVSDKLALSQVISKLDDNDKKLIKLRYYGNKTQTETAKILGMSQVQVSRREKKLLNVMRGLL